MNLQEAVEELKKLQESNDPEDAHERADDILCQLLESMNCEEAVKEFEKIGKWYA